VRSVLASKADEATIEDLMQDVYLRLCDDNYSALRELRAQHNNSIYAYLRMIAVGLAIDHIRKNGRVKRGGNTRTVALESFTAEIPGLIAPANRLETTLLIERIDTLLDELFSAKTRVRDKSIFWLRYRHGFTVPMIASIGQHGLSEKGIESLLKRTVDTLREKLK
jgi:RNA polymerase sigma-70 factor (ECF subfamily)